MGEKQPTFEVEIGVRDILDALRDVLGSYVCRKLCLSENVDNEALEEPVFCPHKVQPPHYRPLYEQQRFFDEL